MKHLNVQQLSALMQSRHVRRQQCFEKVLEQCFVFIKKHADKDVTFCFYEVPDFIIGYPLFDLNECIAFIMEKLRSNDFIVRYFFPRILYISWNINEINEEKLRKDMTIIKALNAPASKQTNKRPAKGKTVAVVAPQGANKSVSFVKSVKEFKPSGKIVLNL